MKKLFTIFALFNFANSTVDLHKYKKIEDRLSSILNTMGDYKTLLEDYAKLAKDFEKIFDDYHVLKDEVNSQASKEEIINRFKALYDLINKHKDKSRYCSQEHCDQFKEVKRQFDILYKLFKEIDWVQ